MNRSLFSDFQPYSVHGTITPDSNVRFDATLRGRFVQFSIL
jgi:hypothetical protein